MANQLKARDIALKLIERGIGPEAKRDVVLHEIEKIYAEKYTKENKYSHGEIKYRASSGASSLLARYSLKDLLAKGKTEASPEPKIAPAQTPAAPATLEQRTDSEASATSPQEVNFNDVAYGMELLQKYALTPQEKDEIVRTNRHLYVFVVQHLTALKNATAAEVSALEDKISAKKKLVEETEAFLAKYADKKKE